MGEASGHQEAPSSSCSTSPTDSRPSQLSITLLPSSSLLQPTTTKGTTVVFTGVMFSLKTSTLSVNSSPSLFQVTENEPDFVYFVPDLE